MPATHDGATLAQHVAEGVDCNAIADRVLAAHRRESGKHRFGNGVLVPRQHRAGAGAKRASKARNEDLLAYGIRIVRRSGHCEFRHVSPSLRREAGKRRVSCM